MREIARAEYKQWRLDTLFTLVYGIEEVMSDLEYIKIEALELNEGETKTVKCCFCGSDSDKLSITRTDDGILYNCWRASCSGRGFIGSMGHSRPTTIKDKNYFKPNPYTESTVILTKTMLDYLFVNYRLLEFTTLHAGWRQDSSGNKLIMTLIDRHGKKFGDTTKNTKQINGVPKAMHYITAKRSMLHFAFDGGMDRRSIVLVEDVISATRITQTKTDWLGVALLGTDLNNEKVKEIKKFMPHRITIALDPDATAKAFKLQKQYGIFFNNFSVSVMSADPKDLSEYDLIKELGI